VFINCFSFFGAVLSSFASIGPGMVFGPALALIGFDP